MPSRGLRTSPMAPPDGFLDYIEREHATDGRIARQLAGIGKDRDGKQDKSLRIGVPGRSPVSPGAYLHGFKW
jgi:hypothetical protein